MSFGKAVDCRTYKKIKYGFGWNLERSGLVSKVYIKGVLRWSWKIFSFEVGFSIVKKFVGEMLILFEFSVVFF